MLFILLLILGSAHRSLIMPIPYSSNYNGALSFTGLAPQLNLLANTPLSYTIPGPGQPGYVQKYVVTFDYESDHMVYVALNATATVPTSGTINTTSVSEPKPCQRFVSEGDVLSFITPNTSTNMGFSLRTIQG